MSKYLSAAETAKLVRQALKRSFPAIKFSVRSDTYSGGASIDVRWTDGPTSKLVDGVVSQFKGGDFDGMIDMKINRSHWMLPNGSTIVSSDPGSQGSGGLLSPQHNEKPHPDAIEVHFGADFIFTHRKHSPALVSRVLARMSERYDTSLVRMDVSDYDGEARIVAIDRFASFSSDSQFVERSCNEALARFMSVTSASREA